MASITNIPVSEVMKHQTLTITLTGLRQLKLRLWIARGLFKLAAVILGCGVEINAGR